MFGVEMLVIACCIEQELEVPGLRIDVLGCHRSSEVHIQRATLHAFRDAREQDRERVLVDEAIRRGVGEQLRRAGAFIRVAPLEGAERLFQGDSGGGLGVLLSIEQRAQQCAKGRIGGRVDALHHVSPYDGEPLPARIGQRSTTADK